MTELHTVLTGLTTGCLYVLGAAWTLAAVYFSVRVPGGARPKLAHFVRTIIPEPWLLILAPALSLLISLAPKGFWASLRFWQPLVALPGVLLIVASTALMLWARWVLGTMWASKPLLQEGHQLRTSGPYALVRHPIYAGFAGMVLGGMLADGFGVWIAWALGGLAFVAWRVRTENRMMTATFGDAYRDYSARVPALVPFRYGLPRRHRRTDSSPVPASTTR